MSRRVVVLGSVNTDLVLRCSQMPLPGQTVHGRDFQTLPGGKGANQAVAAARLGASVSFIGCVGDDAFGHNARRILAAEGMDTQHLHSISGASTGVAMILVDDAAQNCIVLDAGANAALSIAQVDAAKATIQDAGLLICQLECPLPAVQHGIALAHAAGVPVLLNPAPTQALPPELLAQVDVLVPNETEAAALLQLAPGAAFDATAAADRLRTLGPPTVIITLGAHGVQLACDGSNVHLEAPVVQAVDTTGAGDTFIGAYAAAWCGGASMTAAIAYAQQAAAISVTRAGAQAAMPRSSELPLKVSGRP
ncbi:ribokinase [Aquabacterium sp.]|uniref:ribokinase n=1 Tax=Aquabacterium sp. TaxID=1872578 RepID=UPI002BBFFC69|nr:ribokinase [Aquabacterium sp.]HSW08328.1 ribokinase [Aquabacterium sp.]